MDTKEHFYVKSNYNESRRFLEKITSFFSKGSKPNRIHFAGI